MKDRKYDKKRNEGMLGKVKKQIETYQMLSKGDRVLVGLSGGADSICLTQLLWELLPGYEGEVAAVYCHHGIRGEEADKDLVFVRAFCEERGIRFFEAFEKVEERAKKEHLSVEEAGRAFRYETFARLMKEHGYQKLAVAHHGEDRAETMLFHLMRGTGIAGLCSMEPVRNFEEEYTLIRPLLWTKKSEIESWLQEKGISWRTDETNESDMYTRNQIRHQIIPVMARINDRAVEHMGETADQIRELQSYLQEEKERIYKSCVRENQNQICIDGEKLCCYHSYMIKTVLHQCLAKLSGGKKDLGAVHVAALYDLLLGTSGRTACFPHGIRGIKEYSTLLLMRKSEDIVQKEQQTGEDELQQRFEITMDIFPADKNSVDKISFSEQEISKNECTKQFDYDKIKCKPCMRFWQPGDYIYLREDGGRKKLSRYFIDEKIPSGRRGEIPLLADGDHIMWIIGRRMSAYYKVTEETKEVLSVTVKNKG